MRFLLVFLILLFVAIFLGYPPLIEDSDGECSALEQRFGDLGSNDGSGRLSVGRLYGSSSSSPSGTAFAKDHYPMLPPAMGCALAYWKSLYNPPASAALATPQAPQPGQPPVATEAASAGLAPTISRDITPNADPISPATVFTLPMDSVAVRVPYAGGRPGVARFQLLQGRTVLTSCNADRTTPGTAWCKFNVSLRKGVYSISFTANSVPLGRYAFTVIGR